jgi:hypothetical protein
MKKNVGSIDRAIRVIVGLVILAIGYRHRSWWGLIGLLPILTALVRCCPAYLPFGISTCPAEPEKKEAPPAAPGSGPAV